MNAYSKKFNWVKLGYYLLLTAVAAFVIYFASLLLPLLLAAGLFAYVINPLVVKLEHRGFARTKAVVMVYLSLVSVLVLIGLLVLPMLVDQVSDLKTAITNIVTNENLKQTVRDVLDKEDISELRKLDYFVQNPQALEQYSKYFEDINSVLVSQGFKRGLQEVAQRANAWMSAQPQRLFSLLSQILNLLAFILLVPVVSFFLLKDLVQLKHFFYNLVPNRYFEIAVLIKEKVDHVVGSYIRAMMVEILVVWFMSAVVFQIVGVKGSLFIGLIAGLANMVPYLGPAMGALFAIISLLLHGQEPILYLYTIIGVMIVQWIDNNIVYPMVVGNSTEMHPLAVMLVVIAGGYAFGIMGMFFSVPLLFLFSELVKLLHKNLKQFEII